MNRAGFTILLPLGYESYNDREKSPLESENVESNPNIVESNNIVHHNVAFNFIG